VSFDDGAFSAATEMLQMPVLRAIKKAEMDKTVFNLEL
jgi:hypothetical protein